MIYQVVCDGDKAVQAASICIEIAYLRLFVALLQGFTTSISTFASIFKASKPEISRTCSNYALEKPCYDAEPPRGKVSVTV
jgi:hypothetical protein